jgi:hypothetical protein
MHDMVTDNFIIYTVVLMAIAVLLLLTLVVMISIKMSNISQNIEEISDNARKFVKLGVSYFKDNKPKGPPQ